VLSVFDDFDSAMNDVFFEPPNLHCADSFNMTDEAWYYTDVTSFPSSILVRS
jgi:hypothetical protein